MIGEERDPLGVRLAAESVDIGQPTRQLLAEDHDKRERDEKQEIPDREADESNSVHRRYAGNVPCGVTMKLPTAAGSCNGLPDSVALRFQGAPARIQSVPAVKRTVCPCSSVDS